MNFYDQYPMMKPHVGNRFHSKRTPSILLIGESHYLPQSATQHLSPEAWYDGSYRSLSPDECDWISTAAILRSAYADNFASKAQSIWRNSFWEINEHGPCYPEYKEVIEDVASYNFFLRPGKEGMSLRACARDVELANEVFLAHYQTLKPSAVIFLSRLAYNHFQHQASVSVPVVVTPHPGCVWWNRRSRKYGGRRGRDVIAEFIGSLRWPNKAMHATR